MFLTKPILHISNITQAVTDEEIISALHECLRARLQLDRSGKRWEEMKGTVEFEKLENAEKAYATLHNCDFPDQNCTLKLSHSSNPKSDPKPKAKPQLIKFLPAEITPGRLFNLFRPFGPIYKIALNHYTAQDGLMCFSGTAIIEFYDQSHALLAQTEMHCSEVDDQTIAVEEYDDKRDRHGRAKNLIEDSPNSKWARAKPFVPSLKSPTDKRPSTSSDQDATVSRWASQQSQNPYTQNPNSIPVSPRHDSSVNISSSAISHNTAHPSPESLAPFALKQVDPCNLFIKNLGPDVDSGDLFQAFKQFGTIVSARVMKNDGTGVSKEFGFVSYTTEEATSKALKAMDGSTIGQSPNRIVVRLHELKKFKEGRTKLVSTTSPHGSHLDNGNEGLTQSLLNKLSVESPEMSRLGSIDGKAEINIPGNSASALTEDALVTPSKESSANQTAGRGSSSLESTPVSTAPLTPLSEREKMLTAVLKLNDHTIGQRLDELIELLMGLPAKERKLCLFNPQMLAIKVCEAKEIMETPDDLMNNVQLIRPQPPINAAAFDNAANHSSLPTPASTPSKPDRALSPSSVVAIAGSLAPTPGPLSASEQDSSAEDNGLKKNQGSNSKILYSTIEDLVKLSSKEIVTIAFESPSLVKAGLIPEIDSKIRSETDEWINKLSNLTIHQQKQKVGEKVFKTLRGFGIKGCPKITVDLLDSEDLRSLAHLMNSLPDILKQKVLISKT